MQWWQAIVLGIVEGVTEFLPISSTGHLTITEKLMGLPVNDPAVTAYTAIIQVGAIAAAIIYFWRDIVRIVARVRPRRCSAPRPGTARLAAVAGGDRRFDADRGHRPGRQGPHRGSAAQPLGGGGRLILCSGVMVFAERAATQQRHERDITLMDGLVIGLVQCFALIPGVSRSGATISAGLLRDLDRVTATRMSFFLGIPALTAAGLLEAVSAEDDISGTVGWGPTASAPRSASWWPMPRSPGCCGSSRATRSITFVWYRVGPGRSAA